MSNTLKKIWSIVSTVLVVLVVLCAVFLMGSRILGYQVFTVLSGSMQPEYDVWDLVYVKQVYKKDITAITDIVERNAAVQEKIETVRALVDDGTIEVGDVISYVFDENLTVVTHRIIGIDQENHRFYTQGDANETEDSPVLYENTIGEVHFSIPKLGFMSYHIQKPPGVYIAIGAGVVLILLVFLPDMLSKKKKQEETVDTVADNAIEISETEEENARLRAEVERLRAEVQGTTSTE